MKPMEIDLAVSPVHHRCSGRYFKPRRTYSDTLQMRVIRAPEIGQRETLPDFFVRSRA